MSRAGPKPPVGPEQARSTHKLIHVSPFLFLSFVYRVSPQFEKHILFRVSPLFVITSIWEAHLPGEEIWLFFYIISIFLELLDSFLLSIASVEHIYLIYFFQKLHCINKHNTWVDVSLFVLCITPVWEAHFVCGFCIIVIIFSSIANTHCINVYQ